MVKEQPRSNEDVREKIRLDNYTIIDRTQIRDR